MGTGPAYRGAEGPTKVQEAASGLYIPRRGGAGGVPGGERGLPGPPPRELGGPAPPTLPVCRWVCPSVSGSPRLGAVPRRSPRAAQLSALPRAAPPAPPGRQHRRAGPRLRTRGSGGPWLSTARARAPRPRRSRPPSAAPRCSRAVTPRCPRALRSAPCPAALASGPGPENPAAGRTAIRCLPPRLPSTPRSPSPCPSACLLCPRAGLSVSPCGVSVFCLPPSQCLPCLPPPLPWLSPLRVSICPPLGLRLSFSVSLSLPLSVRPPLSRTQARASAASPARPGARAPAARGAPRTPNSRHAAPLCETFAPPHT